MVMQKHKIPDYWAGIHLKLDSADYAPRVMDPQLLFMNNEGGNYLQQSMKWDWYLSDILNSFFNQQTDEE
jgi:hypothetical protein